LKILRKGCKIYQPCIFIVAATKAFDRVKYRPTKLVRLLLARRLPPVVLKVLLFMYTHSAALFSWNGSLSRHFCVLNGVKQGGVLSPVFCVYFDELMCNLSGAGRGCHINLYLFNLFISMSYQLKHHKTHNNKKQMTRPEWRVQDTKPLMYSHIDNHNIHTYDC